MNQIIKGTGFHHIALKVNDFDKSLDFYQKLGFTVMATWGEGDERAAMIDIGDGGLIEMFAGGKNEEALGRFFHLAIKADDIEMAYQTALDAGAKPRSEPKTLTINSSPRKLDIHIAFVFGPDGEVIEFFKNLN